MKTIQLTQGQVALVDDWWYEELSRWKWKADWSPNTQSFYAVRTEGKRPFRRKIWMHRQIMNTPKRMECDHINHSTLDCQEHNLRNVTRSQNMMNRRVQSNNKLGEKCISLHRTRYRVRVQKDGKYVFSKNFRILEEAIATRDEVVKQIHGEFAYRPTSED